MNRFEQLIEYVINDEEAKARELFHEIVVEKSREIYENLMAEEAEEDLDESKDEEELDEAAEEDLDESAEEEELDETAMGGDAADDLIDNVETDEEADLSMEDEEVDDEEVVTDMDDDAMHSDMGGDDAPATKSNIMNLEDKMDELMADFEAAMKGMDDDGSGFGADEGGDAIAMDDTEEMDIDEAGMMEAVNLKAAPKPVTAEQGDGKAGPVAFNSGAAGMASKPVKITGGDSAEGKHDTAAYKNTTKDLIGKVGNTPAQGTQDPKPATKPHLAQATGVNTKSPLPGRKG